MIKPKVNKTLLILIDACSKQSINSEEMQSLRRFINPVQTYDLHPDPGYLERLPIFTGIRPESVNIRSAYHFKNLPERSLFKLLNLLEKKIKSRYFSRIVRKIVWRLRRPFRLKFKPLAIPWYILNYIELSEDGENGLLQKNIDSDKFDLELMVALDRESRLSDKNRLRELILKKPQKEITTCYFGSIDAAGHRHGPNSLEFKKNLRSSATLLEETLEAIIQKDNYSKIIICGDHGMSQVSGYIDISNEIRLIQQKMQKRLLYFIDSIYLRILIDLKSLNRNDVKDLICLIEARIGKENIQAFRIEKSLEFSSLTEFFWELKHGIVFHPSFFAMRGETPPNGMHGYSKHYDSDIGFYSVIVGQSVFNDNDKKTINELHNEL